MSPGALPRGSTQALRCRPQGASAERATARAAPARRALDAPPPSPHHAGVSALHALVVPCIVCTPAVRTSADSLVVMLSGGRCHHARSTIRCGPSPEPPPPPHRPCSLSGRVAPLVRPCSDPTFRSCGKLARLPSALPARQPAVAHRRRALAARLEERGADTRLIRCALERRCSLMSSLFLQVFLATSGRNFSTSRGAAPPLPPLAPTSFARPVRRPRTS